MCRDVTKLPPMARTRNAAPMAAAMDMRRLFSVLIVAYRTYQLNFLTANAPWGSEEAAPRLELAISGNDLAIKGKR